MMVTKHSGEKEAFSDEKLVHSLQQSGISSSIISSILVQIHNQLYHGIPTRRIHQKVRKLLINANESVSNYCLKQSILELVNLGCSFETYIGYILRTLGYETHVNVTLRGTHAIHEIDVIAEKEDCHYMIECAFHDKQGVKNDIRLPLYSHSRFNDVEHSWRKQSGQRDKFHQGWIVTNNRLTSHAIAYSESVGLRVLGWDYPAESSLKLLISAYGLHPITCITGLTRADKKELLDREMVLCRTLCDNSEVLQDLNFEYSKIRKVLNEGKKLCEATIK